MHQLKRRLWRVRGWAAFCALAGGFLLGYGNAPAQTAGAGTEAQVREDFKAGLGGDQARFEKAMKACEAALQKNPKDAEAKALHGTGDAYLAGKAYDAGDDDEGGRLMDLASKEFDEAVSMDPSNVVARMERARNLLNASNDIESFDDAKPLLEKVVADYQKVMEVRGAEFDSLPKEQRGEVLYGLAEAYHKLGQFEKAKPLLERIVKELDGTDYQRRARKWLDQSQ